MEMASACTEHQGAVGGFTVVYNYEEGEDDTCPVCKLQAKNDELKKKIDFMAQENNQICSDFQNYRSLYGPGKP